MTTTKTPKKTGRPRKGDGPRVSYQELDRLLVMGEEVETAGGKLAVVYPTYREIARRFGVSHSLVSDYSKKHNCLNRRAVAENRVAEKVADRLVELRAQAIAVSREDALKIIDGFLMEFEKALHDGRVRVDNPSDFNLMVRLKEFLLGNADSRQEIRGAISLEEIQKRHRELLAELEYKDDPRETSGVVRRRRPPDEPRPGDQLPDENPPAAPLSDQPQELTGQVAEGTKPPTVH
jgi:transposase-like protein